MASCDQRGEMRESPGLNCVVCHTAPKSAGAASCVLPCLHFMCHKCLSAMREDEVQHPSGIFACPACHFMVQSGSAEKSSKTTLKNVPALFLDHSVNGTCAENGQGDAEEGCCNSENTGENDLDGNKENQCNGMNSESCDLNKNGLNLNEKYFCTECDDVVPGEEIGFTHRDHDLVDLPHMLKSKREYIATLLNQINSKINHGHLTMKQMDAAREHLKQTKQELRQEIEDRSQVLIEMISRRKSELLEELDTVCSQQNQHFVEECDNQSHRIKMYQDSYEFADQVIQHGSDQDLLNFHNDITSRLLHLVHRVKDANLNILSLRVDVPERGKEESHLEKLFGSLMKGNIACGDADLLHSFNIDLKWPTSLVTTRNRDIVIAGKEGTFDSQGKLLFYDRQGNLHCGHEFQDKCIPYDVACAHDGTIFVSDNKGRVSKFTPQGKIFIIMKGMFKGSSGRIALTTDDHLLVTSSEEQCIWEYSFSGAKIARLPRSPQETYPALGQPHCLTTNLNNDFIISDLKGHNVSLYNSKGELKFCYTGGQGPSEELRCPSSICCDPFNNILVADFTNDAVHLVSQSGQFLGFLLTKENKISCPNFVSLDHEGHLFIGQYGGDIAVYRYLSYVKHA